MPTSMATLGTVLLGSLLLAGLGGQAAADDVVPLSDRQLDLVTAGGAVGLNFSGYSSGIGSLSSLSLVNGVSFAGGNQLVTFGFGYNTAAAYGGSSTPGTSSANASTNGNVAGDYTFDGGFGVGEASPLASVAGALTFGAAVSFGN